MNKKTKYPITEPATPELREPAEAVAEPKLDESLTDPDANLEFRGEFVDALKRSIGYTANGGKTIPIEQVAKELGLSWPPTN